MQTPSIRPGPAEGLPLTQAAFLAALAGTSKPWVQVRRRHADGHVVLCGQVIELATGGGDWFKVDTEIGVLWAEGRNVRMCSGDGRCTCEDAAPAAEPSSRGEGATCCT